MQNDQWLALALLAFVSSITPGPNNLLATSSGARFGLRRTLPQITGVTAGFVALLCIAATGLGRLVVAHPTVSTMLAVVGNAYLLWLSGKLIASAYRPKASTTVGGGRSAPMTFAQSALFQCANPKAWMMALSAASLVAAHGASPATIATLCAIYAVINFPCVGAWAVLGARLQPWLHAVEAPWRLRTFDGAAGASLLATTAWMIASR